MQIGALPKNVSVEDHHSYEDDCNGSHSKGITRISDNWKYFLDVDHKRTVTTETDWEKCTDFLSHYYDSNGNIKQTPDELNINKHKFYSQFGQDWVVFSSMFKYISISDRPGFYVDLAAAWYKQMSNSFFFDKCLSWNGLCIEPEPALHSNLKKYRSCQLIPNCIWNKNLNLTYLSGSGKTGMAGIALPHKNKIKSSKMKGHEIEIEMECKTLQNIFQSRNITHIDFFSLDIEGSEINALMGIDFNQIQIDVIVVENNDDVNNSVEKYLHNVGFVTKYTTMLTHDIILVHQNAKYHIKHFDEWNKRIANQVMKNKSKNVDIIQSDDKSMISNTLKCCGYGNRLHAYWSSRSYCYFNNLSNCNATIYYDDNRIDPSYSLYLPQGYKIISPSLSLSNDIQFISDYNYIKNEVCNKMSADYFSKLFYCYYNKYFMKIIKTETEKALTKYYKIHKTEKSVTEMYDMTKCDIVIHVRSGDAIRSGISSKGLLTIQYYIDSIKLILHESNLSNYCLNTTDQITIKNLFILTQINQNGIWRDTNHTMLFSQQISILVKDKLIKQFGKYYYNVSIINNNIANDLELMMKAPHFIMSPSTFSSLAALYRIDKPTIHPPIGPWPMSRINSSQHMYIKMNELKLLSQKHVIMDSKYASKYELVSKDFKHRDKKNQTDNELIKFLLQDS